MKQNPSTRVAGVSFLCVAVIWGVLHLAGVPAFAQGAEKELRDRIEKLEKVIQDYKRIMEAHEEELRNVKEQLNKQAAAVDEKVEAAVKKPEHLEYFRHIMESIRLTEKEETPEEKRLKTLYDEGFFLKGADDQLRIAGWLQADSRWFLDEEHPENNTALIRRARLDIRGVLENDWAYRLYGTLIGERNGILQEGWLEYRKYGEFRVRAGEIFEPFSLEAVYSARWTDFIERAMIVNALSPQEDIGIMAFGKVWQDQLVWALGLFNGQGRNRDAVVNDKDITTRLVYKPFLHPESLPWLKDLHLGGSFSTGNNERDLSGSDFTTHAFTPFFDIQPGVSQDDRLTRWGLETEYLYGPFSLKAEYLSGHFQTVKSGNRFGDLDVDGFYLNLAYVLTGEAAPRDAPIKPSSVFDPSLGGWGAWQVAARYQALSTNRNLLNLRLARGTDKAQSVTVGLNWFPNRHIRFQFNFDHAWFDDDILVQGVPLDSENTFIARFLYDF
ncbi:MAG: porin [Thermodesulfobacteriota bacterium]